MTRVFETDKTAWINNKQVCKQDVFRFFYRRLDDFNPLNFFGAMITLKNFGAMNSLQMFDALNGLFQVGRVE